MKKVFFGFLASVFLLVSCEKLVYIDSGGGVTRPSQDELTNETMIQYFHWYTEGGGKLWRELKNNATSLSEMGITALWLPPAYKGSSGSDVGYGVYDMYDLGEFNQKGSIATKYGTKDEYLAAINAAHSAGLKVYADVVFNHRMGADSTEKVKAVKVQKNNRNQEEGSDVEIEAWTKFDFDGRGNKYSSFKWTYYHFDGVDWANNFSKEENKDKIYKFRGDGAAWDWEVDSENGNYDYLMGADVNMDHPDVVRELKSWGKWYVNFASLDGFRMDAVKHIKFQFFPDWLSALRAATGKTLFTVGEYWSYDLGKLQNFLTKSRYCMSLFDAPLHKKLYEASNSSGSKDMGAIFNDTLTQYSPPHSVTLVDNHDTQPCQALESPVLDWFKPHAYALILLRHEGYPCVFYPDLYGAKYSDNDKNIDMKIVPGLKEMLKIRKLYAYGAQHDYFDDSDVIGWTMEGLPEKPNSSLAVIMTDKDGGKKKMYVGKHFAGKEFRDCLGNKADKVTIDSDGWGEFSCNGGSVSVYILSEAKL